MVAAIVAFLLAPPLDPAELLRRVAARYSAFDRFFLEVRESSYRGDILLRISVTKRLASAPGGRFSLEVLAIEPWRIVSDGAQVYGRQGKSKKYAREDLGGDMHQLVEGEIQTHIQRFAMLDRAIPSARFQRLQKVKLPSGPVECAVVSVSVKGGESAGWHETLWIDPVRSLVLRSDLAESQLPHMRTYREYTLPPGVEEPARELFTFQLHLNARPVPAKPVWRDIQP